MEGKTWEDVVQGAKNLIEYISYDHINPKDVQIVLIFFSKKARLILDS